MSIEIIGVKLLGIRVCVPQKMPADEIVAAVEREHPCGTTHGWNISRRPEVAPVECEDKADHIHLVLDA